MRHFVELTLAPRLLPRRADGLKASVGFSTEALPVSKQSIAELISRTAGSK
jgi:hypothetical protein